MKSTRLSAKRRYNPIEDSDEDVPLKKKSPENKSLQLSEDSSSDSDIETYLKAPSKLDLNSSFFNPIKTVDSKEVSGDRSNVAGRLSDSEPSEEEGGGINEDDNQKDGRVIDEVPCSSTMNTFEHINTYNAKFEETKRFIEMYKARKAEEEPESMEVDDILEKEEKAFYNSLGSSGFETLSDEENKSDWEEVQVKDDKSLIQTKGVEITINIPGNVKKKKSLDLMAAVKRRINRVKKENQIFVHKAHLLCWIAHGLYINAILNNQNLLGMALSLLPSKHCYPSNRIDLNYLENIVQWYRKMMTNKDLTTDLNGSLEKLLEDQMLKKEAHSYKSYIYIFICILRSLGAKCRLMLSLQLEPIRPPQSELCSLSDKKSSNEAGGSQKTPSACKAESTRKINPSKKVSFKINTSMILDKSLNRSLKEVERKKQTKSSSLKKEVGTKASKVSTEKGSIVKDKHDGNSDVREIQSKQKMSLRDKLKKSCTSKQSKDCSKIKEDRAFIRDNETSFKKSKHERAKQSGNTKSEGTKEPASERIKEIGQMPTTSKSTDTIKALNNDSKPTGTLKQKLHGNVSKISNEGNTAQKSTGSASKEESNLIGNKIESNEVKNRRSTRRNSKSPMKYEEIPVRVSECKKELNTKRARGKKLPVNKKENNEVENVTTTKKMDTRHSKMSVNEEKVEKTEGESSHMIESKGRKNSNTLGHDNDWQKDTDEGTNRNPRRRKRSKEKAAAGHNVDEESYREEKLMSTDPNYGHCVADITSRPREHSKSPMANLEENTADENQNNSRNRRQLKNPINDEFVISKRALKTEGSILSKVRKNSRSSGSKMFVPNNGQDEISRKESDEAADFSSIKTRLRRSSKSPTTISEGVGVQNNVCVKDSLADVDEVISTKTEKIGLKIKMPLQNRLSLSNTAQMEGSDEESDNVFEVPKKIFSLPIIKQELLTPKKHPHESDDDFLGFSAEEATVLLIPQLDGGADTPITKKIKSKPNLTKLKTSATDTCLRNHPARLKKMPNYNEVDSDDDFSPQSSSISKTSPLKSIHSKFSTSSQGSERSRFFGGGSPLKSKQLDVRNDIVNLVKKNLTQKQETYRQKLVKRKSTSKTHSNEDDSDYFPEKIPRKKAESDDVFKEKSTTKVKRRIPMKKDLIEIEKKKVQAKEEVKKNKGLNVWVEVFAEAEEKWISVDVIKGQVHCVKEIYSRATHPVTYILGFDNDNHVKDVTKRYCENWNTVTRKLRIDNTWWEKTLRPYRAPKSIREKEEDQDLARQELDQPLPKSISEYKNHPLYALKRHLLKFEAIYPPNALTLGFVRNEPVYARDCVYVLHSRDIWLKHAKVVKPGEQPYKIVKARPKYDKLSNTVINDQMLEIFGKWQIEDYVPPTAENGIVPKNAYGNVDLFKPCMLPKRTVHLQFPALNKVARKLNIDCAPAVTGFDFHSGFSHPVFDGFVVCEEFSEQLVAAWVEEQEEFEKKEQEKIEKRIYDNWKKLIKGLLIRERLKRRYNFGTSASSKDSKSENAAKLSKNKHR